MITRKDSGALKIFTEELDNFIHFLQESIDPKLEYYQAVLLAAVILQQIPLVIRSNSLLMAQIKEQSKAVREESQLTNDNDK